MSKEAKNILSNVLYIAAVLFLSFLIVRFVGQRTEVIGNSMVPTLQNGNQLITDKITYRFREPERFEVIVFPHEPVNEYYIKRIIGLPGETLEISEDGRIFIDGKELQEEYEQIQQQAGQHHHPQDDEGGNDEVEGKSALSHRQEYFHVEGRICQEKKEVEQRNRHKEHDGYRHLEEGMG